MTNDLKKDVQLILHNETILRHFNTAAINLELIGSYLDGEDPELRIRLKAALQAMVEFGELMCKIIGEQE